MGGIGARAKYAECIMEVRTIVVEGLTISVESDARFRLARGSTPKEVISLIEERGKKVGVLIKAHQRLVSMEFRNGDVWVPYERNDEVARECALGFGEARGDQWAGFSLAPKAVTIVPERQEPELIGYGIRFRLENFRTRLQVVPLVHACLDLDIARYHVIAAAVLRPDDPRVRVSVSSTLELLGE